MVYFIFIKRTYFLNLLKQMYHRFEDQYHLRLQLYLQVESIDKLVNVPIGVGKCQLNLTCFVAGILFSCRKERSDYKKY